jgi:hypothetical protein
MIHSWETRSIKLYRAIVNDLGYKKFVYFEKDIDTSMKQLENIKETGEVFAGNIYCNIGLLAASGASIAIIGKWRLNC